MKSLRSALLICFAMVVCLQGTSQPVSPGYPVKASIEIIPYGTDNSVSGPFLQAIIYGENTVVNLTYGVSYQDVFHLNHVNDYPVLGIKQYLRKAELNFFNIKSVTVKADGGGFSYKKIKGWNNGLQFITTFFSKSFNGAYTTPVPRGLNPDETYFYYPTEYLNTNFSTLFLRSGHTTQRVFWNADRSKGGMLEFCVNAFFTIPQLIQFNHVNQKGEAFTGVAERSYKNLLGGCVGLRWVSYSRFGLFLGFETGVRPGLCHADARYGTGTDIGVLGNSFFDFKLGISTRILKAR